MVDKDGNIIEGTLNWQGEDKCLTQAKEYNEILEFIPNNELYNNKYKNLTKVLTITVEVNPTLDGAGSKTNPFLIRNLDELIALSNNVRDGISYKDNYFKLTNDIELTSDNKFMPIGIYKDMTLNDNGYSDPLSSRAFEGNFDGDNHTISNISKDTFGESAVFPSNSKYTIFGYAKGGEIKNLTLNGSIIVNESKDINEVVRIASLVGFADSVTIINITNNVNYNITSDTRLYIGGILAELHNNTSIDRCVNNGEITAILKNGARGHAGGIIGFMTNNSESKVFSASNLLNTNEISIKGQYISSPTGFDSYKISAGGIIGLSIQSYNSSNKPDLMNMLNLGDIHASYTSSGYPQSASPYKSPIIGFIKFTSANTDDNLKEVNTNKLYYKDNTVSSTSMYFVSVNSVELASGEIAYLLGWYQNLTDPIDDAPTLDNTHKKVYENVKNLCPNSSKILATIEYTNTEKDPIYGSHNLSYSVNNYTFIETCSYCNHRASCAVGLNSYTYKKQDTPITPPLITTYSDDFIASDNINSSYINNESIGNAKVVVTFKDLKIELPFEITDSRIPVIYKVPIASKIKINSKLGSSILQGGEVRDNDKKVEGSFNWLTPEEIISEVGLTTRKAIFTPLNTEIFKNIEFDLTVEAYQENTTPIVTPSNNTSGTSSGGTKTIIKEAPDLCSVFFNTNGAEEIESLIIKRGRCISSADLHYPTKEGYTFAGWYLDPQCVTKFNIEYSINTSLVLYAKWEKNLEDYIEQKIPKSIVSLIINSKSAKYNDDNIKLDVAPITINGRTYAPLRFVAQGLGTNISWMSKTKTATLTNEDKVLEINTKTNVITTTDKKTNKMSKETLKDMFVKDGRIMAPVRFISEAFDALVEWTRKTNTVTITK